MIEMIAQKKKKYYYTEIERNALALTNKGRRRKGKVAKDTQHNVNELKKWNKIKRASYYGSAS